MYIVYLIFFGLDESLAGGTNNDERRCDGETSTQARARSPSLQRQEKEDTSRLNYVVYKDLTWYSSPTGQPRHEELYMGDLGLAAGGCAWVFPRTGA